MLPKPPAPPKKRAKKKSKVIQKAAPTKAKAGRGGARKGAGRKPKAAPQEVAQVVPAVSKLGEDELFTSLPLKQRNFIVNYLINGFNATQAAKDAGYSHATADSQACRLLKNAKVKVVIAARTQPAFEKKALTAQRVIDELEKLAMYDPRGFYRPDGSLKPISQLDEQCGAALAGMSVVERDDGSVLKKIKGADKHAALVSLGRYFKLFTDKVEHKVKIERVLVREALKEPRKLPPAKPEFE